MQAAFPENPFIAEDLGYVTEEVRQLQLASGYPGMKVLEFAFDSREAGNYLPHLYPTNSVCYTGTHDNVTLKQWFSEASDEDIAEARAYLGLHEPEGDVWGMIRGAMSSISDLCIVQMQDYLQLGGEARMNCPGTLSGANWSWRAEAGFATEALAEKIRKITVRYGRE
jgi:4-alpha-glucanotransferase